MTSVEAGYHIVSWDGEDVVSGIYFVRFKVKDFIDIKKLILMK